MSMWTKLTPLFAWLLALGISGCATTPPSSATVAVTAEPQPPATSPTPTAADDREKTTKRAKLQRELDIARRGVAKSQLSIDQSEARDAVTLEKTEHELRVAQRKLTDFQETGAPIRMSWTTLSLQRSEDGVRENEEELNQLEMMYADEELGDKTKEIVLQRGRRRLERARTDLDIRRQELATLKERTLPLEADELEAQVKDKQRQLEQAHRDIQTAKLDKQIELMRAQSEVTRIEEELAALDTPEPPKP